MKRIVVVTAVAVISIVAGAFVWQNNKVQAMKVQVNVKDIPEQRVRIIPPSDPSFDKKAYAFLKSQPQKMIESIKPFSVIVENMGELAIVGSRLNWEIMKSDGKVVNMPVGSANPGALMAMEESGLHKSGGAAIPPHSTRFVSLIGSAGEGQEVDPNANWLAFRGSQSEMEEFINAINQGRREEAFNQSIIPGVLRDATSITISIDGIFFEDGTFVGDDKTGFFNEIKAHIDAQYDLLTEISVSRKQKKTSDEIFKQVSDFLVTSSRTRKEGFFTDNYATNKVIGGQGITGSASKRPASDSYDLYKTMYAQQLLQMREAFGASEALARALNLLKKNRIELRKK